MDGLGMSPGLNQATEDDHLHKQHTVHVHVFSIQNQI